MVLDGIFSFHQTDFFRFPPRNKAERNPPPSIYPVVCRAGEMRESRRTLRPHHSGSDELDDSDAGSDATPK